MSRTKQNPYSVDKVSLFNQIFKQKNVFEYPNEQICRAQHTEEEEKKSVRNKYFFLCEI